MLDKNSESIWLKARVNVNSKNWKELTFVLKPFLSQIVSENLIDSYFVFFDLINGCSLNLSFSTKDPSKTKSKFEEVVKPFLMTHSFEDIENRIPGEYLFKQYSSKEIYYNTYCLDFYSLYSDWLNRHFTPIFFINYSKFIFELINDRPNELNNETFIQTGVTIYFLSLAKVETDRINLTKSLLREHENYHDLRNTANYTGLLWAVKEDVEQNRGQFEALLDPNSCEDHDRIINSLRTVFSVFEIPKDLINQSVFFKSLILFIRKTLSLSPLGVSIVLNTAIIFLDLGDRRSL